MRRNVFRIIFFNLAREFEFIEDLRNHHNIYSVWKKIVKQRKSSKWRLWYHEKNPFLSQLCFQRLKINEYPVNLQCGIYFRFRSVPTSGFRFFGRDGNPFLPPIFFGWWLLGSTSKQVFVAIITYHINKSPGFCVR